MIMAASGGKQNSPGYSGAVVFVVKVSRPYAVTGRGLVVCRGFISALLPYAVALTVVLSDWRTQPRMCSSRVGSVFAVARSSTRRWK